MDGRQFPPANRGSFLTSDEQFDEQPVSRCQPFEADHPSGARLRGAEFRQFGGSASPSGDEVGSPSGGRSRGGDLMRRGVAFSAQELRNAARAAAESNMRAECELLPDGTKRVGFTPFALAPLAPADGIPDATIRGHKW